MEHLAMVLWARMRRNNSSRFNNDTSTKGIVRQPISTGMRHRDMDAQHQDEEVIWENLRMRVAQGREGKDEGDEGCGLGQRWLVECSIMYHGPSGENIMMKHCQHFHIYTFTKHQEEHYFPLLQALLNSHLCWQVSSPCPANTFSEPPLCS